MKTEKEIRDKANQKAMGCVFRYRGDLDIPDHPGFDYEYLQQCAKDPEKYLNSLVPWESYKHLNAKQLLAVVDDFSNSFQDVMKWAQGMSTLHHRYEHEFYYNKEHDWYLHVNDDCNRAGESFNRQLMTFDRNGNVIKDPRLDDNVWQFEFEPCYDIRLENEAVFNSFSTTDEEYEIRLAESGILEQINKK